MTNDVKLKNKIKEKIKEYTQIDNIILTTFEFDPNFFELQLLPYLFDVPNYKNMKNQSILVADAINKKLNFEINVYYDNIINDKEFTVRYKAHNYHQTLSKGVFHPKLIIITGKKQTENYLTLFVSSANLTINSYAINKEVFAIYEDKNENENLISEKNVNLKEIFKFLNDNIENLYITGLDDDKKLLSLIKDDKDLKIITPFLDEDMVKKYRKATILLTTNRIHKLKNKYDNVRLYQKDDSHIHAKIYILNEKKVIIGSHNFTKAAFDNNIEASILIEDKESVGYLNKLFEKYINNSQELDNDKIEEPDDYEKDSDKKLVEIKSAIVDYTKLEIQIVLDSKKIFKEINISTSIYNLDLVLDKNASSDNEFICKVQTKILKEISKNKYFELTAKDENNKEYYAEGIFYENTPPDFRELASSDIFEYIETLANDNKTLPKNLFEPSEDSNINNEISNQISFKYDTARLLLALKNITINNIDGILTINNNNIHYPIDQFVESYNKESNGSKNEDTILLFYLLLANKFNNILTTNNINISQEFNDFYKTFNEIKNNAIKKLDDIFNEINKKTKNKLNSEDLLDLYLKHFNERSDDNAGIKGNF